MLCKWLLDRLFYGRKGEESKSVLVRYQCDTSTPPLTIVTCGWLALTTESLAREGQLNSCYLCYICEGTRPSESRQSTHDPNHNQGRTGLELFFLVTQWSSSSVSTSPSCNHPPDPHQTGVYVFPSVSPKLTLDDPTKLTDSGWGERPQLSLGWDPTICWLNQADVEKVLSWWQGFYSRRPGHN